MRRLPPAPPGMIKVYSLASVLCVGYFLLRGPTVSTAIIAGVLLVEAVGLWYMQRWAPWLGLALMIAIGALFCFFFSPKVPHRMVKGLAAIVFGIWGWWDLRKEYRNAASSRMSYDSTEMPAQRLAIDAYERGNQLRSVNKEQAVAAYTEALEHWPEFSESYYNRALTLAELGRADEAMADVKSCERLKPEDAATLRALFKATAGAEVSIGNASFQDGDLDDALIHFQRGRAYAPDDADPWIGIGIVHACRNEGPEARTAFDRAIALDAGNVAAHLNRARLCLDQGDFPQVILDASQVIRLEPDCADAYRMRAQAHDGLSNSSAATDDRNRADQLLSPPRESS